MNVERCECGLRRGQHHYGNRTDHEFVLAEPAPLNLRVFAADRTALTDQLEELNAMAYPVLEKFHAAHPELVPCGDLTFRLLPFWRLSGAYPEGIQFSHDCLDHGYDLPDHETVVVPVGFVNDNEAWEAAHAATISQKQTAAEDASAAARRAQFEALRTEFEPASSR